MYPKRNFIRDCRLEKGDKGWATIPPSPPPLVNDPGDPDSPHEG